MRKCPFQANDWLAPNATRPCFFHAFPPALLACVSAPLPYRSPGLLPCSLMRARLAKAGVAKSEPGLQCCQILWHCHNMSAP
eukprot:366133-Chlamydomonas_euryale.AAC.5